MFIPDAPDWFRQSGITALIYDPRITRLSDWQPRNDIDPLKQAEDYHDALTFLAVQPMVDWSRIVYWGFPFSGSIALAAAALDKRAAGVIMGNKPLWIPIIAENGTNPAGFCIGSEKEDFDRILKAKALTPSFNTNKAIQTYYRVISWQPFGLMSHVSPMPVMILTAASDQVSLPED
ncbi:hypothetical protein PG999_010143 [Apiospora kogelbergensis]|uniref:Alpha/beta hydrolase family protein n=1 Tax=Apiospora kogelbergensis TaxID=1337665 RepID=A0AAW0QSI2_9PEZI